MDILFGNKCVEFYLLKPLSGGFNHINFFAFDCSASFEGDHSPSFFFLLILLNLKVIEFNWYDIRHMEDTIHE